MTSTLKIDTIEPEGATTTLTVGESGQNSVIAGAGIKANVLKDAGANAIFTSNGSGVLSSVNSGFGSSRVLLQTTTISSTTASINFTSGIDSTYDEYLFDFINMTLSDGGQNFFVNFSTDGGSNYNAIKTTTAFWTNLDEDGSQGTRGAFEYKTGFDKAQSTGDQLLNWGVSDDADSCLCGELHLFNPASTVYVKNFYATTTCMAVSDIGTSTNFTAGFLNTTSAVNAVTFFFDAGDIEGGTIKMYGIK